MNGARESWARAAPFTLLLASGFAALGYQIIWTQQASLWLGHDWAAVLAVVTAFFAGLACGGWLLGPAIERSARPRRWYIACELGAALWSLLLLGGWSAFAELELRLTGVTPPAAWHWFAAFTGTFLVFLPATAGMGATLPAMERLTAELGRRGRSLSLLYAFNTAGGVLGVLGVAFVLIPAFGLQRSAALCVVLNVACAVLALLTFPRTTAAVPPAAPLDRPGARSALTRLGLTGFLGIAYEVLVVRVLSQVTEDTVYTFALLLAVYLVSSAGGAAAYRRWLEPRLARSELGDRLLAALACACLLSAAPLWAAEGLKQWALEALGSGVVAALAAEALLALAAFGLPTLVMGALFSHLSCAANQAGVSFGRAAGINLAAAAAAPMVCGVLVLPALGAKALLLLIAAGYLAATSRRSWRNPEVVAPAALTLALGLFAAPLTFVEVPPGGSILSYEEGVMAAVSVVGDADGVARLRINNRQQEGSSASLRVDARQAWLPLLLHPAPRRVLFLGLGTGVTAASAAEDPTLDVDVVELLPEVISASSQFARPSEAGASSAASRLHITASDARRYVRASQDEYDVIVSDNFHPARSGSGALYTVEQFRAVSRRLRPDGLFCQWLPLHQLDLETLRSITSSFVSVYPRAFAIIASSSLETPVLGLVARADSGRIDVAALHEHFAHLARPEWVSGLGLEDEQAVLGSVIGGPHALARFAERADVNTDDRPTVAYRAPLVTYAPASLPRDRLIELLGQLSLEPEELILPAPDPSWARRLSAYWRARNRFIESGRDVQASASAERMLAQVREPLLGVLRLSPDFRPAYDPLLALAGALLHSDVTQARALLSELSRIQPEREEAAQLLALIDAGEASATASRP